VRRGEAREIIKRLRGATDENEGDLRVALVRINVYLDPRPLSCYFVSVVFVWMSETRYN